MSMVKPIGVSMNAFDATQSQIFSFTSNGGNQVVKNKIIIRLNSTNSIVYQNTQETYVFNQIVNANTLTNGQYYNFSFITYDVNGDSSSESSPISFYCYSKGVITFNNVSQNQTIGSANYTFNVTYSQAQNELIDFLKFYIYDSNNNLIGESDNLYSTQNPPIEFSYDYNGFENNTSYKIKAMSTSINNQKSESGLISFIVKYTNPVLYSKLEVENRCDDGYNQINSNVILIDGETNPTNVDYIDNSKANIVEVLDYIKWKQGYSIDEDFTLEIWYELGNVGKQFKLVNSTNSNTYFIGNWVREIPYGETTPKDYVEVIGYVNNVETFYMRSNYVDISNNTTDIVLWFKFNPNTNTYELILNSSNQSENILYWNDSDNLSNVQYGRLTTIQYEDEEYIQGVKKDNLYGDMSSIYPITNVELYNGVYDNIDISCKITKSFTTDKPIWDYCTFLNCDFSDNVNGGNVNIVLSQLSSIKVKCREIGSYDWITLKNIEINTADGLNISAQDYHVPSGKNMEYAIVPILNGGIEGDYIIEKLYDIKWNKVFVSDDTNSMSLFNGVSYGDTTSNMDVSTLQPIMNKYPTSVQNGETDYESGSVSGYVLQEDFINELNRNEIVKLNQEWAKFLKNGKSKIIKDWNGNIWVARVNSSPTRNYNQSMGNGFGSISFTFVEQGKWNNEEDLIKNNIV